MSLYKENELGKISISNTVFASIIRDGFQLMECKGRVWPASKKGRQIGNETKFNLSDFGNVIETSLDEDGRLAIEFSIIVKFGTSIKKITDALADYLAENVESFQGSKPAQITIRISGVKSKQIARRNTEVIKRYDINR